MKSGDIIFRKGKSLISNIVLLGNPNSQYSHVGVVIKESDSIYIIHAIPSENKGDADFIKKESLSSFCDLLFAEQIAIYRLKEDKSIVSTISFLNNMYDRRINFDNDFNLESDSAVYCTELVWKAFKKSGIDLIDNEFDEISYILSRKKCIFPSRLTNSCHLELVFDSLKGEI